MDGGLEFDDHLVVGEGAGEVEGDVFVLEAVVEEVFGLESAVEEAADFVYQAFVEAGAEAAVDAGVAFVARDGDADVFRLFGQEFRADHGVRLFPDGDFEGADEALARVVVGGVVGLAELLVAGDELFGGLLLEFGAERRIGRHVGEVVSAGGGLDVETAAAAEDRGLPSLHDVAVRPLEVLLVLEDVVFFSRVHNVDQVVGDFAVIGQVLARADVHPAVHLPRVAREDFSVEFSRLLDRIARLSGGRRSENADQVVAFGEHTANRRRCRRVRREAGFP